MKLLNDISDFLETLTFIDFVFFFAVVLLMILVITLLYFIKINETVLTEEKPKTELELINEAILSESKDLKANFVSFEKEQEEKAIISYDELVKRNNNSTICYSEEKEIDGLHIKKVDLSSNSSDDQVTLDEVSARVISYQKEEDFLKALKTLQSVLN